MRDQLPSIEYEDYICHFASHLLKTCLVVFLAADIYDIPSEIVECCNIQIIICQIHI